MEGGHKGIATDSNKDGQIVKYVVCRKSTAYTFNSYTHTLCRAVVGCFNLHIRPANTAKTAMTMGKAMSQRNSVEREKDSLHHHMKGTVTESSRTCRSR